MVRDPGGVVKMGGGKRTGKRTGKRRMERTEKTVRYNDQND